MTDKVVLEKVYDPRSVEPDIYMAWEESGAFRGVPDGRPREKTYTIVIPPPNVTGALHLGHALNNTLQDILIRYHRMRGFNTLWQPGTDHAGIATQAVVERRIRELEGKSRHDLGREELVRRIWEWKDAYEARITGQLKEMGCSCDWERTRFTLDAGLAAAVRTQFFNMFKDGLIFRGKRLVNWDTELQTAVSNDEVYYETVKGKFWHFKYPVIDPKPGEPEHVVIATTRPETMLGDTAVAVCPDPEKALDELEAKTRRELEKASAKERPGLGKRLDAIAERRETHLPLLVKLAEMARDGRKVRLPLVEREIPLIADEHADPLLGTGCVKITPAHDPNDYDVWQRHPEIGAPINVLTPDGKVVGEIPADFSEDKSASQRYGGLEFTGEGRDTVVADLDARGLLGDVQDRDREVGHSDRSKTPIEPYLSDQWFVTTGDLNESGTYSEPQASACPAPRSPDLSQGATLLTWTTYGAWLPGDERGFVSRVPDAGEHVLHNLPGEPYDSNETGVMAEARRRLEGDPVSLNGDHARVALRAIAGACARHGVELLGVAIMRTHVHVLCQAEQHGSELLQIVKGNTSRELNQSFVLESERWWTKSGSRRRIKHGTDLTAAIEYVRNQHQPLVAWSFDQQGGEASEIVDAAYASLATHTSGDTAQAEARGSDGVVESGKTAQAKACGSGWLRLPSGEFVPGLAQAAMDAVSDGRIEVFPPRYAKSYLDWLGEKRDWCISRQLWWGHRIAVWTIRVEYHEWNKTGGTDDVQSRTDTYTFLRQYLDPYLDAAGCDGLFWVSRPNADSDLNIRFCSLSERCDAALRAFDDYRKSNQLQEERPGIDLGAALPHPPGFSEAADEASRLLYGVSDLWRDEDVLDTWFSSALWPFSTLGWPEQTDHLKQYYPGSVLCTSRDIITNWVARMVMFGLYSMGEVPFDHVYIHPKILDGRGETMSKSKGNGVDPVDVIHTHGADALRYTMADMCTETQDIRMPVEYICPHCTKLVDQAIALKNEEQARKSRGVKTTRKLQPSDCHRVKCTHKECGKEFATQWAPKELKDELGLARETSDKFDIGRNFCNKLWNAVRFALMNLEGAECHKLDIASLPPEDRWILAQLSQTIRRYHDCLANYQFAASVKELREFFWDSLCDWYIELTKPRLSAEPQASACAASPESSTAKQVLAFCIDQCLRLWHPTMPFITERLWSELNAIAPKRGLPGVADLTTDKLLVASDFPAVDGHTALDDDAILRTFGELQAATRGVRDLRLQSDVSPKERVTVTVVAPANRVESFKAHAHVVEHMAGATDLTISGTAKRPPDSASLAVGELHLYVHGISDDAAERERSTKALADVEKQIEGKRRKLDNEKFVANAKPEVVEAERARLAELEARHASLTAHLAELDG